MSPEFRLALATIEYRATSPLVGIACYWAWNQYHVRDAGARDIRRFRDEAIEVAAAVNRGSTVESIRNEVAEFLLAYRARAARAFAVG